jgi:hypothetical protein
VDYILAHIEWSTGIFIMLKRLNLSQKRLDKSLNNLVGEFDVCFFLVNRDERTILEAHVKQ